MHLLLSDMHDNILDPIESLTSLFSNITLGSPSPVIKNTTVQQGEDVVALIEKWSSLFIGAPNQVVAETTDHLKKFPNSFVAFFFRGRSKILMNGNKIDDKSDWNDSFQLASKKKRNKNLQKMFMLIGLLLSFIIL